VSNNGAEALNWKRYIGDDHRKRGQNVTNPPGYKMLLMYCRQELSRGINHDLFLIMIVKYIINYLGSRNISDF
jgi:hypothetical protein